MFNNPWPVFIFVLEWLDYYEMDALLKLCVSFILGAFLGLERELSRHPAGLRTHILVTLGSTGFMLMGLSMIQGVNGEGIIDPSRLAQGVVTGIGFLGAGAIMKEGVSVHGLTTAASIWVASSIGLLVAVGEFALAFLITGLTLLTLFFFQPLKTRLNAYKEGCKLVVKGEADHELHRKIPKVLEEMGVMVEEMDFRRQGSTVSLNLAIRLPFGMTKMEVMEKMVDEVKVLEAFWAD